MGSLRKMFEAYGQAKDTARAAIYREYLDDLSPAEVADAVAHALQSGGRFLPTISELRAYIAESKCDLPDADVAWGEVLRAVSRWGRYRIPQWSSPAMAEAVEAVGWQAICDSENQDVTRAHFARAYRATRVRALHEVQVSDAPRLGGVDSTLLGTGPARLRRGE